MGRRAKIVCTLGPATSGPGTITELVAAGLDPHPGPGGRPGLRPQGLARYRSSIPLLAFTTESATRSQLALTWGAESFLVPSVAHTDDRWSGRSRRPCWRSHGARWATS